MASRTVERLTGVYQADGSLIGELRYFAGKLMGRAHCALCDITHGTIREKEAFTSCRAALPVPLVTVHLDERSEEVRAFTEGRTPCVIAHTSAGLEMLLTAEALEACASDVQRFHRAVMDAMRARDLSLTPDGT